MVFLIFLKDTAKQILLKLKLKFILILLQKLYYKNYILDKYDNGSLRNWILEVDFEYPKELYELSNGYPFASYKLKINGEMLLDYQLKTADDYIYIGNFKKISFPLLGQRKAHA